MTIPYHGIMNSDAEPDSKKLHHLFRQVGMDEDGALTAVQEIRSMAGQNILAKMDTQTAELRAQSAELRAQGAEQSKQLQTQIAKLQAENKYIRWFLSTSVIFAALVIAISQLYLAFRVPQ